MKAHYLFPSFFRIIGLLLAIPGFILGYLFLFCHYTIPNFGPDGGGHIESGNTNTITGVYTSTSGKIGYWESYTNELALTLVIVGLLFIAFSRLKREDELTAQIRLNALYWAILINYLICAIWMIIWVGCNLFNINLPNAFPNPLDYNLFMPLVVFILRFYYLLYRNKDEYNIAPLHFLPFRPFNKISKIISIIFIAILVSNLAYLLFFDAFWANKPVWVEYSYSLYYIMPLIFLMWVYSKEPIEDEYISTLRLEAMQIALYVNYGIILIANLSTYLWSFTFFETINLSTIPLIFILLFQYRLYRLRSQERRNRIHLSSF